MDPSEFAKGDEAMEGRAKVKAPPKVSATHCAKGTGGVEVRETAELLYGQQLAWRETQEGTCGQRVSCLARQGGEMHDKNAEERTVD